MVVAICRLELRLAENHSLKGKRQIVASLTSRLRNRFNVSAAEVEEQDVWQTAVLGLAYVSNQTDHARRVLESALRYVEGSRVDAELVDSVIEVVHL
jgi:uncharacterized protein YlxP (DUF503 family)